MISGEEIREKGAAVFEYIWFRERKRVVATVLLIALLLGTAYTFQSVQSFWSGIIAGAATLPAIVLMLYVFNLVSFVVGFQAWIERVFTETIPEEVEKQRIESSAREKILTYSGEYFGHHFNKVNDIDINWVDDWSETSTKEVLCIPEQGTSSEHLARIMIEYANNGVVPDSRGHLRRDVSTGLSCYVAEDILDTAESEAAGIIRNQILFEEIEENEVEVKEFSNRYEELESIHREGFLGSILLNEYKKISSDPKDISKTRKESADLLHHLSLIAEEEDNPLFQGEEFDFHIQKVSRKGNRVGYNNNISKIFGNRDHPVVYILALGNSAPAGKTVYEKAADLNGASDSEEKTYCHDYKIKNEKYGEVTRFYGRVAIDEGLWE